MLAFSTHTAEAAADRREARAMATHTLRAMADGGLRDHLGGTGTAMAFRTGTYSPGASYLCHSLEVISPSVLGTPEEMTFQAAFIATR